MANMRAALCGKIQEYMRQPLRTNYGKFGDFPYISSVRIDYILFIGTERSNKMKFNPKWIIGIVLAMIGLFSLPFIWRVFMPYGGYGMMRGYGYGYGMPMMSYGFGMMPFGMLFMLLISLGI